MIYNDFSINRYYNPNYDPWNKLFNSINKFLFANNDVYYPCIKDE